MDLTHLSVAQYKALLAKQNLLPGRRLLWQEMNQNFILLENSGMKTVAHLQKALATPGKLTAFSLRSGIPEDYLVLLRREIGSLVQKPIPLQHFPGMDPARIEQLKGEGVQTSKDYFESNPSQPDELYHLCDLVRINGVGVLAAKAFYHAGYPTVASVAAAEPATMLRDLAAVNGTHQFYCANLGLKDMQFCIDFAVLLTQHAS